MMDDASMDIEVQDDELPPLHCAVAVRSASGVRQVGVAFVGPRSRTGEADRKSWRIGFYEFLDNDQFSHLESVLLQLQCASCYMRKGNNPTPDVKKIISILECIDVQHVDCSTTAYNTSDLETDLARLLGSDARLLTEHLAKKVAMSCVAALISRRHLLSDAEVHGAFVMQPCSLDEYAQLDNAAVRALNLLPDPRDPGRLGSVHALLSNGCWTKAGARLLRQWVLQPLVAIDDIRARQNFVELLIDATELRDELRSCVKLPDVERIAARLQRKNASLGEIVQVVQFAELLPTLLGVLRGYDGPHAGMLEAKFCEEFERLSKEFQKLIDMAEEVIDMPLARARGEYRINPEWNDELRVLQEQHDDVSTSIEELQEQIKSSWGSKLDIKCENDPRRGVILRTKRSNDKVLRQQPQVRICAVLKDGVRFTTPKLNKLAKALLDIKTQYEEQQAELVAKAVEIARTYVPVIEAASAVLAELDAYNGMAMAAATAPGSYCKPKLSEAGVGDTVIREARHPVLEVQDDMQFIPNDFEMLRDTARFHIITGPNMGGKSTYIRQLGSLTVMAQMGCFIPAAEATVCVVDCVLARVGAGDLQARGVSTFMAEMLEAATILKTATASSLVIIDELGRGTSTYDGFGLAWAISEHLAAKVKCMCMFATHFHELTALETSVPGVCNRHVTAHTTADTISMLYEVKAGSCPSSFGIHVAELAAFPPVVVEAARRKAAQLEKFSVRGRELIMATATAVAGDSTAADAAGQPRQAKRRRVMASGAGFEEDDKAMLGFLTGFAQLPLDSMAPAEAAAKVQALLASVPAAVVARALAPTAAKVPGAATPATTTTQCAAGAGAGAGAGAVA